MTITTKENANGRISGYYVDGVKVRKNEIDGIINDRRDEVIYVDYYTGQEFKMLTRSFTRQLKVVFTGYSKTIMTQAAADELGYNVIRNWTGTYSNACLVEKKNEEVIAETDGSEDDEDEVETFNVMPAEIDDEDDELIDPPAVETINSENALAAEIARVSEINRRVFEKTDELTRKDERELFKFEAELKAATTTQIMATETANRNTSKEKPAAVVFPEKKIPVKITANGNVNFFLNGKRVNEKIARDFASSNYMSLYWAKILGYNGKFVENCFASPITAYQWLRRMADKNRNYADGSWIITRTNDGVIKDIFVRTSKKQTITDAQLQDYIDALDAKEHIESMYRCAQNAFKYYCNSYGLTPAQAQEIYIAVHARDVYDDPIEVRAMIDNFQKINSVETDGSEDDIDDQNDVFKLLPAIERLNDVDTNQTKDEMKAAADQMGLMQLNRKIADLEEQLIDNRRAATAILDELDDETTLSQAEDIKYRYFEKTAISHAIIDEKAIYKAAKSTRLFQIAAIKNLMRKNETTKLDRLYRHKALLTKVEFEHMERKLTADIAQRVEPQKTATETPLTKEQIEKLMGAIVQEREEFYDALEEAETNEEISQSHIDYLNGEIERLGTEYHELWAQLDKLNDVEENTVAQVKIAQPQDNFTAELAKLQTEVNNTQAAFIKAQDAHEQATDALKNFLNDTAFKLKQKFDALPLDYTITLKKTSGATYHFPDFSEIYIGAYHIGCDAEFHFEDWRGRTIARYDTPTQVETVIDMLKAAIARGDKEFTFPTVDELNTPPKMPSCAQKSPDITAAEEIAADDTDEPETTENAVKAICECVRNVRRRGINHVVTSKGRHMWYYGGCLTSKDIVAVILAKEGFTIEEYIAAEETAEDYWWNVELPRMVAIDNQATFLEDKHKREVKTYDEELTANVMPPEVDDSEDELVDPPDKADIHDSLARAMKIALLKVQDFCREYNLKAAQNELSLYSICANAMREEVTI